MKKSLFSVLSATAVALSLTLLFSSSPYNSKASNGSANANVTALEAVDQAGECTGPKTNGECESRNTAKCSDLSGCNSTVEQDQ